MNKIKVLFICLQNSARSQMAEAFLNTLGSEYFFAESAGLNPGEVNPLVVEVMHEVGVNLSDYTAKNICDFFKQGKYFHYVISVCDESKPQNCIIFPGMAKRINWSFRNPAAFNGNEESKMQQTRILRDQIKDEIEKFISNHQSISY